MTISRAACLAALPLLLVASACNRRRVEVESPTRPTTPSPTARAATYPDGESVISAMRARYVGKWYTTMTFVQKTSRLLPNGTWNVQTWYEAAKLPGRLRIDFDPVSAGNGVLYARDSQFVVQNGRSLRGDPAVNALLLLGFDVYARPVAATTNRLRREGFDLARVHQTSFNGRPTIVVGARRGDLRRKQFWVDAERLYFVRMLEPQARDTTKVQDIRFTKYERRGGAWLAPRVEIYNEGKLVFYEDYEDVKLNVALDDALFDPSKWKTVKHWTAR